MEMKRIEFRRESRESGDSEIKVWKNVYQKNQMQWGITHTQENQNGLAKGNALN